MSDFSKSNNHQSGCGPHGHQFPASRWSIYLTNVLDFPKTPFNPGMEHNLRRRRPRRRQDILSVTVITNKDVIQSQHKRATKRKGNKIKPSLQQQPLKKVGSQQRGRESWWGPSFWSRGQADPEADHIPFIIIDKTTNLLHLNMSATLLKKSERWEKRQLLSV